MSPTTEGLPGDPWLDRWLPLIERHAAGRPILEIARRSWRQAIG
jgi:hypothetical protein